MTATPAGVQRPTPADAIDVPVGDGRTIRGHVDAGWGSVLDQFKANFRERDDLGAGCSVVVDGRMVVDLWGGVADLRTGREWQRDTAAVAFSCTKGWLALCVYLLVQDGRLDLDAPIARYWPEFGRAGKRETTLRQAMSHRAGVASLDADLSRTQALAWDPVVSAIEHQAPHERPDAGFLYHALTYGWIVGEVIRRVTGNMPGDWFAKNVAEPLDLSTWIGLPPEERHRVAVMEAPLPDEDSPDAREAAATFANDPRALRALTMGDAWDFPADEDGWVSFNDPDVQAAEVPGANGISTPSSLATLYAAVVGGGVNEPLLTHASIADLLVERSAGRQLNGLPDDGARWGTGFQLSSPPSQPMLGTSSFGHAGAGGQLGYADVEHHVGFAYLSNQMGGYGDARARELSNAVRRVLGS